MDSDKLITFTDNFIFSSVILFGDIGTGFFYKVSKENKNYYTIIINNHMIEDICDKTEIIDEIKIKFYISQLDNTKYFLKEYRLVDIRKKYISLPKALKSNKEENDLFMIILNDKFYDESVKNNFILSNKILPDLSSIIHYGTRYPDIKMIGYPNAIYNYPFVRSGFMASPILTNLDKR